MPEVADETIPAEFPTADWMGRFQEAFGLAKTGEIDGVTAALLMMHSG